MKEKSEKRVKGTPLAAKTPPRDGQTEKTLRMHFDMIDTSGDGLLTFDELMAFLTKSGKRVNKEQVLEIMVEIDDNQDGYVDFSEFVEIFKRSRPARHAHARERVQFGARRGRQIRRQEHQVEVRCRVHRLLCRLGDEETHQEMMAASVRCILDLVLHARSLDAGNCV